jgi:hypothetical protein
LCVLFDVIGYLSSPCNIDGSLFTGLAGDVQHLSPAVELRLLNTLFGNSPETLSRLAQAYNFDEEV